MAKYVKLVIEVSEGLDHAVKLEQKTQNTFNVTYGGNVMCERGSYTRAMQEFSECVAHSANCMGNEIKFN